jgi:3-deoxy-D-manno-octulosonate 8-phosphate phosphatase (KDO 8-P phosphatase)
MQHLINKAKKVRCLICDLDGVLTDCRVFIDNSGNEYKGFNIQDGFGIKILQESGIEVAIITGSKQDLVKCRTEQLNIKHYYPGSLNKQLAFDDLKEKLNLTNEEFAYIGDDLPDLIIMKQIGFSIAPANAVRLVKESADWHTELSGGHGAVREACDFILQAQGTLSVSLEKFLQNA